jgi:hypothetical protein
LGKTVAVSFEGDSVKIVHAFLKGEIVTVKKTETIPENEFNNYLSREKASEFIVTSEFRESFHDIVVTPVVKDQFLKKIVESEIRKAIIQKDFSFIYMIIGEKVVENKKVMEVFYYAVPKDAVRRVVERFYDNGKTVRALYPAVLPVASLIESVVKGEADMGIFNAGKSRSAFFIKKGKIHFIRNYESFEAELSDFDIQNINMTTSYCFQNIKVYPSSVFLIGPLSEAFRINSMATAPLACLCRPENIHCSGEQFREFTMPLASFLTPRKADIQSREFRGIYQLKNYMAYASRIFIVLTLICIGAVSSQLKNMTEKKEQIRQAQKSNADIESVFAEYRAREEKIRQYMPVVEFLNRPVPSIRRLFISLGETEFKGITISKVNVMLKEDNDFSVLLEGAASSATYTAMQDSLDRAIKELDATENLEIINHSAALGDKTFTIEATFRAEQ